MLEFHHLRIAEMFLARATCKYMLPRLSFWYHRIGNKTVVIKFQVQRVRVRLDGTCQAANLNDEQIDAVSLVVRQLQRMWSKHEGSELLLSSWNGKTYR